MSQGFVSIGDAMRSAQPKNQALWETAITRLKADHDQGKLTLKGPALAYYMLYADLFDPLRVWVTAQLDARITATTEARLGGGTITDRHVCPACFGKGVDAEKETCEPCGGIGLVCPICRGSRWTTDARPARHPDHAHLAACPGCMIPTLNGYKYDFAKAQRTIQSHTIRPYVPVTNVSDEDMLAAYARAEANAKTKRDSPPEASALGQGRRRIKRQTR